MTTNTAPQGVAAPAIPLHVRLRFARDLAGLDQAEVAEALHVSRAVISKWERGASIPNLLQGHALARVFRVPLEWLVEGDEWDPTRADALTKADPTRSRCVSGVVGYFSSEPPAPSRHLSLVQT